MNDKIQGTVDEVVKRFGAGAIMVVGRDEAGEPVAVIPTGSVALDAATRIGGYARGRVVELYGPRGPGKTALALHAVAQAQAAGGTCAFVDAEHAFDLDRARAAGVDVSRLLVSQPDTAEQALDIAEMLARSGAVDLVVVDSVGALVPRADLEGESDRDHVEGLRARIMSQALRKLTAIAHRTGAMVMFVNHLEQRAAYASSTTGGNALKFYASMRLDVREVVEGKHYAGVTVLKVKLAKNKLAPPFTEAQIVLRDDGSIDAERDLLAVALERGLVEKRADVYSYGDVPLGRTLAAAAERLAHRGAEWTSLRAAVLTTATVAR